MNKLLLQRGGTILGFIVGLIVGLVIAVVVAMVVTKTAIPFSSKQSQQGKISEPTASQMADPNKPLYSNSSAAKEAAKLFVKDGESADTKPDDKSVVKKDNKATAKPDDKSAVKKDDKATAKKDDKAAKTPSVKDTTPKPTAVENWSYYLQTNAYRERNDAEVERARLALTGFEARISEAASQGQPLYRIRLGPFSTIDTMNRVRKKLTDSGINAAVIRTPK